MRHSVSRLGFCLVLALLGGFVRSVVAQSIAVSTLTLSQSAAAIVWDPTRSRFFVASGTSVLMVNPETAALEDTIPVGGVANQIAVSDDGQYLYASLLGEGRLNRYRIQSHALDVQIALGMNSGGNTLRNVQAMVALPGQPASILVSLSDNQLTIFDNAVARAVTAPADVRSLYVRPSDGAFFGLGDGPPGFGTPQVFWLTVTATGVSVVRSVPVDPNWDNGTVTWNGSLIVEKDPVYSSVFDLNAGATIGRVPRPQSTGYSGTCALAPDSSGTSAMAFQYVYQSPSSTTTLVQYGLGNLRPVASAALTGLPPNFISISGVCDSSQVATWGTDGILISQQNSYYALYFLHTSGLTAVRPAPIPTPAQDASGVIHLSLPANGLVFDPVRNLLWASVPGNAAAAGNAVVSIDPSTGNVIDTIYAGSEPGALALSADGSHLFATLAGAPAIASVDLTAKQSSVFIGSTASSSRYWSAQAISAIAGTSNSVVAVTSLSGTTTSGASFSVVAYDAGVPRKNTFDSGTGGNIYADYVQTIFPADAANAYYAANTLLHYSDATHDVFRLIVDSNGVKLDTKLNNLLLGQGAAAQGTLAFDQPASLIYNGGHLLTSAGQILTPDTKRILGSVALTPAYGMPVPFSDQNGVVYVQSYAPSVSAIFYDAGTLRPIKSIPVEKGPVQGCDTYSPNAVNVVAAVRAGNAVAIAADCEIAIAPLGAFQSWPSATGALQPISAGVREMNMPANAIGALPGTSKLLLATPSTAGNVGNSVVTFNPDTGQIESAAPVGSEPSILSAAPDGSAVYAYLSGEFNVARVNVASGSRDLVFAADPTGGTDQYSVFDMAASPDGGLAVSYPGGAIAVFDSGTLRPQVDSNSQGSFAHNAATFELAFNDSGSLLYGYNSFLSTFELKRDAVSAKGAQWLSTTGGLISGYTARIRCAQGLLYTSYGDVINPERSMVVGQFADPWLIRAEYTWGQDVAPDIANGRAYFLTASGILVFDMHTFALLGRLPIKWNPVSQVSAPTLVRYGANGLAFLTPDGKVYLVDIAAIPLLPTPVPSPQPPYIAPNGIVPLYSSVPIVQPGSWISIFGANLAGGTATWNGDFPTTLAGTSVSIDNRSAYLWYVSPNQINLQVPDDNTTGPVNVKVTTANGSAVSSVTLSKFGPSLSLFDNQYVAAEILTPDGSGAYGGGTYDLAGPAGHFNFKTRPVRSGETLLLYGVGFGPTNPVVSAGEQYTGAAPTSNPVTVTIGGKPAAVLFSGIVAAGLYQINVTVPPVPSGDQPLQASVGGVNAPLAVISVQ